MKRTAVYPGSFDPIHLGHINVARRAAALFDHLIVAIYARPNKHLLFQVEERVALARQALIETPNIEVQPYHELTVHFAQSVGAQVLVRGLRAISDFELEYQMALTNNQLAPQMETICLMTHEDFAFMTGSIVKEIFMLGGDVSGMVPAHVLKAMHRKRDKRGEDDDINVVSLRD